MVFRSESFVQFPSFAAAKQFASWAASPLGFADAAIAIRPTEGKFRVDIPLWALNVDMACKYIYYRCTGFHRSDPSEEILSVLGPDLSMELRSPSLAWADPVSGLTWDVARYFMRSINHHHPDNSSTLMNAVGYAGCEDWRMPTLDEVRTLGKDRYLHLGLLSREQLVRYRLWLIERASHRPYTPYSPPWLNVWSGERPVHGDCDDYLGVNLHNLESFTQQYSEEDGRYRNTAHTLMVRG